MSFFKSLNNFKYKVNHKNIIVLSGNVDDFVYLDNLKENEIFQLDEISEYPKSFHINLVQFLSLYFKSQKYDMINYYLPGIGQIDLNKDLFSQFEKDNMNSKALKNNDFDLEEIDGFQAESIPVEQYINEIIKTINDCKLENNDSGSKIVYILNSSDILLKEIKPNLIASLLAAFIENFDYNKSQYINKKFKLILICKNENALNEILKNGNVEINFHNINYPDIEERTNFIAENINLLNKNLKQKIFTNTKEFNDAVSMMDHLSFREICQIISVGNISEYDDFKNLFRIIFLNKKESEWEKLNHHKLEQFESEMQKRVKGQERAIKMMKKTLIRSVVGLSDSSNSYDNKRKPKGILFFTGPTGVGKTELSKAFAEFIFGDENALIRFDMSEYNHEHSDEKLIGSPPGYVGHESGGQLTNAIKKKPFSVILFDEIEKAHGKILDKFLQILEDGRLTSSKGEIINFSETFIIFTSNIGAKESLSLIKGKSPQELIHKHFINEVEKYFKEILGRPEILNRIGKKNIIPFNFIDNAEIINNILKNKISKLCKVVKKDRLIILEEASNEDLEKIIIWIKNDYEKEYGARALISKYEEKFIDSFVEFIFENIDFLNQEKEKNNNTKIKYKFNNEQNKIEFIIE